MGTLLLFVLAGCATPDPVAPDGALTLRWYRTDPRWPSEAAREGLWWQLSHLGADPADHSGLVTVEEGREVALWALDPEVFPPEARPAVDLVIAELLASDEQLLYGSIDVGRFLSRALDPWPYYAATGACATRAEWEARYLAEVSGRFAVTASMLSADERRLSWPAWDDVSDVAFLAEGGEGSLLAGSFAPGDVETLNFLPNGQARFAVYLDGLLAPAADPEHTPAGAPTKCMWCHERGIQFVAAENADVDGYATVAEFEALRVDTQTRIDAHRATSPVLPWAGWAESHREGERLMDAFSQAPLSRLALEWEVTEGEIADRIAEAGLPTTTTFEEEQLGLALDRDLADRLLADWLPELSARNGHPFAGWEGGYEPLTVQPSRLEYDAARGPDPAPYLELLDCR